MNNVISTRVTIFRNLKDYKFENKLLPEQKQEIEEILAKALKQKMNLINIDEVDPKVVDYLNENALILGNYKKLFVDKKEPLSINLFNGEHLSIVSNSDGFDQNVINKVVELTKFLSNKISFSFTDEFGYLMSDISKLGSGLKIETNIMLSAIKKINKIDQVVQNVAKLGYSLNETKFSGIYTLSTKCNFGVGEKQVCQDFEKTLSKLQDLELESLKMLDVENHDEILDKVQRSFAILNSAHMLNYDELYNLTTNLRIGVSLGIINVAKDKLFKLHHLNIKNKSEFISQSELKKLAEEVKEILKGE